MLKSKSRCGTTIVLVIKFLIGLFQKDILTKKTNKKPRWFTITLQEHIGDYFFFLAREYWRPFIWDIHVGKIGSPPLLNRKGQLSLIVEEGTLVQKKVARYTYNPSVNNIFSNEEKEPFIQSTYF